MPRTIPAGEDRTRVWLGRGHVRHARRASPGKTQAEVRRLAYSLRPAPSGTPESPATRSSLRRGLPTACYEARGAQNPRTCETSSGALRVGSVNLDLTKFQRRERLNQRQANVPRAGARPLCHPGLEFSVATCVRLELSAVRAGFDL